MGELGFDGLLMVFRNADGMIADSSNVMMYTKRPDGVLIGSWVGEVKDGKVKFEPFTRGRKRVSVHPLVAAAAEPVAADA